MLHMLDKLTQMEPKEIAHSDYKLIQSILCRLTLPVPPSKQIELVRCKENMFPPYKENQLLPYFS